MNVSTLYLFDEKFDGGTSLKVFESEIAVAHIVQTESSSSNSVQNKSLVVAGPGAKIGVVLTAAKPREFRLKLPLRSLASTLQFAFYCTSGISCIVREASRIAT